MKRSTRKQRVISVGKGRGFVIETDDRRLVVTAAHCLPKFPPRASISYAWERTYKNLLGAIGKRRTVWTECLFVDPVADIAVLDTPDTQELSDEAGAYERLVESVGCGGCCLFARAASSGNAAYSLCPRPVRPEHKKFDKSNRPIKSRRASFGTRGSQVQILPLRPTNTDT
jgi:hypothetical protein